MHTTFWSYEGFESSTLTGLITVLQSCFTRVRETKIVALNNAIESESMTVSPFRKEQEF